MNQMCAQVHKCPSTLSVSVPFECPGASSTRSQSASSALRMPFECPSSAKWLLSALRVTFK